MNLRCIRSCLGAHYRRLYGNRPDTEHEAAFIRTAIGLVSIGYVTWLVVTERTIGAASVGSFFVGFFVFFAGIGTAVWIARDPRVHYPRRIFAIFADLFAASMFMVIAGKWAAVFMFGFIQQTFGSGYRFGISWFWPTFAASMISLNIAAWASPFWSAEIFMMVCINITFVAGCLYYYFILTNVRKKTQEAEKANEAKSRFVANMSHELRTPLHGILNVTNFLTNEELTLNQRRRVGLIYECAKALSETVGRVLDLSRLEARQVSLEKRVFDLYEVISRTVNLVAPQAEAKHVSLQVDVDPAVPCLVEGDSERVRDILMNFVSNAVKFTEQGYVRVRAQAVRHEKGKPVVRVEVEDTGCGISEEALRIIFEPFTQADDSVSRHYGGTGLGLHIAKKFIELMGGKVGVESVLGRGSTFFVELPFRAVESDALDTLWARLEGLCVLASSPDMDADWITDIRTWRPERLTVVKTGDLLNALKTANGTEPAFDILVTEGDEHSLTELDHALGFEQEHGRQPKSVVLVNENNAGVPPGSTALPRLERTHLYRTLHFFCLRKKPTLEAEVVPSVPPLRVLVAEDNPINQVVARELLEKAGHSVTMVGNGADALVKIESRPFDLALFDVQMPGMGGAEALRRYHEETPGKHVPVIIVTADATMKTRHECEDAGAAGCLVKPLEPEDLMRMIAGVIRQSQGEEVAYAGQDRRTARQSVEGNQRLIDRLYLERLGRSIKRPEFLGELIREFRVSSADTLADLRNAVGEGAYVPYRDALHKLQGGAGQIGASVVESACDVARQLSESELRSRGVGIVDQLAEACAEAIEALDDLASPGK